MGFMPRSNGYFGASLNGRTRRFFLATLDGAIDRLVKRYLTDPVFHEVASDSQTVSLMVHHFLNVTRWTGSRSPPRSAPPSPRR